MGRKRGRQFAAPTFGFNLPQLKVCESLSSFRLSPSTPPTLFFVTSTPQPASPVALSSVQPDQILIIVHSDVSRREPFHPSRLPTSSVRILITSSRGVGLASNQFQQLSRLRSAILRACSLPQPVALLDVFTLHHRGLAQHGLPDDLSAYGRPASAGWDCSNVSSATGTCGPSHDHRIL